MGKTDLAIDYFYRSINEYPNYPFSYMGLAQIYDANKDIENFKKVGEKLSDICDLPDIKARIKVMKMESVLLEIRKNLYNIYVNEKNSELATKHLKWITANKNTSK